MMAHPLRKNRLAHPNPKKKMMTMTTFLFSSKEDKRGDAC